VHEQCCSHSSLWKCYFGPTAEQSSKGLGSLMRYGGPGSSVTPALFRVHSLLRLCRGSTMSLRGSKDEWWRSTADQHSVQIILSLICSQQKFP
jgi:hypothetical protein